MESFFVTIKRQLSLSKLTMSRWNVKKTKRAFNGLHAVVSSARIMHAKLSKVTVLHEKNHHTKLNKAIILPAVNIFMNISIFHEFCILRGSIYYISHLSLTVFLS